MNPKWWVFVNQGSLLLNKARLEHLASLGLSFGSSVYEPGCGVGLLTGFFERSSHVYSSDAREDNVAWNMLLHPWRTGNRLMVENVREGGAFDRHAPFDTVFCYGLLYHLEHPQKVLERLSQVCAGTLLLETRVYYTDNGELNMCREVPGTNQGISKTAYRPARDWVMNELGKYFPYVYVSRRQPDHEDFSLRWPADVKRRARAVFVASRKELDQNKRLAPNLLAEQRRL